MHALIKSEAYYLTHDSVIQRWENKGTMQRRAQSLLTRLQCTGKAYTNIFMITLRENSAIVVTCGKTFKVTENFVMKNIAEILEIQYDHTKLQKFLLRNSKKGE